ncbi:MAG: hypothetical protein C7B47_17965, partial [Sulfobacillus thermosulfidooxidans]
VEYQWWEDGPSGWKMVRNYSPNNTFTIPDAQAGSYPVVVYALDANQIAAGAWSQAQYQQFIANVASTVTLNAPLNPTFPSSQPQPLQGLLLPVNNPVTITAQAANLINPVYQFWYETPSGHWVGSNYTPQNTFTFTPSDAGTYKVVVYAKDPSAPNNATFAVWSHPVSLPIANVTPSQPIPLNQLPASLQALAPRPASNAMPPAPYAQIFALMQNNVEVGPNHPLQAGSPVVIQGMTMGDGAPNLNGNEWPTFVNLSTFANPYHFSHPVPNTIPLYWVKPTPQSSWELLPQPDWANPPSGNQWAIAVTLADVNLLTSPPSSALQLAQISGPIVFGGQHIYTAASWNRKEADLQLLPTLWPALSAAGMPYSEWVTLLMGFTNPPSQRFYIRNLNNVPSVHQTRTIAQNGGWGTNQLTGTAQAEATLSTVPNAVLSSAFSVAEQDVITYLNNPARALWQMPPAVVKEDAISLWNVQKRLDFKSWRFVDSLAIQNQVTIPTSVSNLSQSLSPTLAAKQNASGEWILTIPMIVTSQGEHLVNGQYTPTTFAPIPTVIVLQQVPDVGAPNGVGWAVDQFVY